ncbi:MerR family transcriptional regulator [Sporolactobacillus shoreicorticis]|uniref:MerR family transcriptional regulator n=1 Tax=Sporolactobacillus shoreicorticis TaxID=1923877 RepID=A0ABW5S981_9BACL|nr:MerR family transcriptional regulator [Sporolactobacillus shoreicorticis]MCO7126898.1 MerR family transcriptional regulator [Sporolactobacillus shoreicorticis]
MSSILRIGEFSKLTQISIRMLRYYDETGLLKPAIVDPCTGYRKYSIEQISVLQKIVMLRNFGYSVSEIEVVINNWNEDFLSVNLKSKRLEVLDTISQEEERLAKIDSAIASIERDEMSNQYKFTIKQVPRYSVISLRRIILNHFCEGILWKEMFAFINRNKVALITNRTNFAIYYDEDFKDENIDVEICAVVNGIGKNTGNFTFRQTEEVNLMACTMVYGSFKNIAKAYLSFAIWLMEHPRYNMQYPSRQICHRGPWNEEIEDNYLTEIQIPLGKKT